jgi:transcriptional regulator with XRE-family HTH domain
MVLHDHPLRTYRLSHDPRLSQGQLADLLGVTRTTVARWETGTRKVDPDKLGEIADKTGVAPADLRPDLVELLRCEASE